MTEPGRPGADRANDLPARSGHRLGLGTDLAVARWLVTVYRASRGTVAAAVLLSTITTISKLGSIVSGVVAIQLQLTGRSLGGPWAAFTALPISGSASWLAISVASGLVAVGSERVGQRLRSQAAENACIRWMEEAMRSSGDPGSVLWNVAKVARSASFALMAGTAASEIVVVLVVLALVHPTAVIVAIVSLLIYLAIEAKREAPANGPESALDARSDLLRSYSDLLSGLPSGAAAREVVLARVLSEPQVLAPARDFLEGQRVRTRQAGEAPLLLSGIIVALYALAWFERSDDPLAGAASLAVAFLLLRLAVGSILRLQRAQRAITDLWGAPVAAGGLDDAPAGSLTEALRDAKQGTLVFGAADRVIDSALRVAHPDLHVIGFGAGTPVVTGLRVQDLLSSAPEQAEALARDLQAPLSAHGQDDIGSVPTVTRLVVLLAQQEALAATALRVSVNAWMELPEPTRSALLEVLPVVVLAHPTPRSGLPADAPEVLLVDESLEVRFAGSAAEYRRRRLWERDLTRPPEGPVD